MSCSLAAVLFSPYSNFFPNLDPFFITVHFSFYDYFSPSVFPTSLDKVVHNYQIKICTGLIPVFLDNALS